MRGVDNHLCQKMILAKADTYAKVVEIMKEEEWVSQHLALLNPQNQASVNATSSYKWGQKAGQQAAQGSNHGNGHYRSGGGQDWGQIQAKGESKRWKEETGWK